MMLQSNLTRSSSKPGSNIFRCFSELNEVHHSPVYEQLVMGGQDKRGLNLDCSGFQGAYPQKSK